METKVKTEGSLSFNHSHIYSTYPTRYSEGTLLHSPNSKKLANLTSLLYFQPLNILCLHKNHIDRVCDSKYLESFIMQLSEEKWIFHTALLKRIKLHNVYWLYIRFWCEFFFVKSASMSMKGKVYTLKNEVHQHLRHFADTYA